MYAANRTLSQFKVILTAVGLLVVAAVLVIAWFSPIARASAIVGVSSNIADVSSGQNLIITVTTQDDGDVAELEVDHSIYADYPEFSVYADEADPYGGDAAQFAALGVAVTYSATAGQWVIDFGPTVTQGIVDNYGGKVDFYFALRDIDSNLLWGDMGSAGNPPAPEGIFNFDLVNGTGDELVPTAPVEPATPVEDVVVPGVPNTAVAS